MKAILRGIVIVVIVLVVVAGGRTYWRYRASDDMRVTVGEVTSAEYPEDPSHRSRLYEKYQGRSLRLVKRDSDHFDFHFESNDPTIAAVSFLNIDLGLFIPRVPHWTKGDKGLEIISLVDREWNRQQVSFPAGSENLRIEGGDGFEKENLFSADLARNCLNAGLWEVLLFTKEEGKKALYYQGWFTFPLGHYKKLFEQYNGISYWKHWYRLEHWFNPQGTPMAMDQLRQVVSEEEVVGRYNPDERIVSSGEQVRKARTVTAPQVRCWKDFCTHEGIRFATFVPPGRYQVGKPWRHELERIATLEKVIHRRVISPATLEPLDELELVFRHRKDRSINRFIVSGIDLSELPRLPTARYNKGLYMPMGIGIPPFYQSYADLQKRHPFTTPYFSFLLDGKDRWINHHDVAIDGPVMHRDEEDPGLLHLYLLSYERHSLVAHVEIRLGEGT